MSEQRLLTVRIERDGTVTAETHGLKGKDCLPFIAMLEDLLEAEAVDSAYTAEYHQAAAEQTAYQRNDVNLEA